MKTIRDRFQPTVEREVDEGEYRVLMHQGLIWSGTDEELAALCAAAGLPAPTTPSSTTRSGPSAPAATATTKKEGDA